MSGTMSDDDLKRAAGVPAATPSNVVGGLRQTLETPEFKRSLGLAASAPTAEVMATIMAPKPGTEYQRKMRSLHLGFGCQAGVVAPGREAMWEASYDERPDETMASLATTARASASAQVRAEAEAAIRGNTDPVRILACYAEATPARIAAAAAPPAETAPSAFPRVTAAGRRLEVEQGRVFYGDGTTKVEARATAEGAVQIRGWDGWVTVETFESLGGTVFDSVAASRLAQQMGEDA